VDAVAMNVVMLSGI